MLRRPLIYVAGPYSAADTYEKAANVRKAMRYMAKLWKAGWAAISPHAWSVWMERDRTLEGMSWAEAFGFYLSGDFAIIKRCDAIFLVPGWENSKGSCAEYAFARWLGMPVFFGPKIPSPDEVQEVQDVC